MAQQQQQQHTLEEEEQAHVILQSHLKLCNELLPRIARLAEGYQAAFKRAISLAGPGYGMGRWDSTQLHCGMSALRKRAIMERDRLVRLSAMYHQHHQSESDDHLLPQVKTAPPPPPPQRESKKKKQEDSSSSSGESDDEDDHAPLPTAVGLVGGAKHERLSMQMVASSPVGPISALVIALEGMDASQVIGVAAKKSTGLKHPMQSVNVDIVTRTEWIRLIYSKPLKLHRVFLGQGNKRERSQSEAAQLFLAAKEFENMTRVDGHLQLVFRFVLGVSRALAAALRKQGVVVEGEEVDIDEDEDDSECDDDDDDDDDDVDSQSENNSNSSGDVVVVKASGGSGGNPPHGDQSEKGRDGDDDDDDDEDDEDRSWPPAPRVSATERARAAALAAAQGVGEGVGVSGGVSGAMNRQPVSGDSKKSGSVHKSGPRARATTPPQLPVLDADDVANATNNSSTTPIIANLDVCTLLALVSYCCHGDPEEATFRPRVSSRVGGGAPVVRPHHRVLVSTSSSSAPAPPPPPHPSSSEPSLPTSLSAAVTALSTIVDKREWMLHKHVLEHCPPDWDSMNELEQLALRDGDDPLPDRADPTHMSSEELTAKRQLHVELCQFLKGKRCVACTSAWRRFATVLARASTHKERQRAVEVRKWVEDVPDAVSDRVAGLQWTRAVGNCDRAVLGTGDTLNAVTITGNIRLVRAVKAQGVRLKTWLHSV